jgi:hypothetical protein
MFTHPPFLKRAITFLTLTLLAPMLHAAPIQVIDGTHNGFSVQAQSSISLSYPDGTSITLSDPFIVPRGAFVADTTPRGNISCSWDPTGAYLVVFVPQNRSTDFYVVNLSTKSLIPITPAKNHIIYPSWYDDTYATADAPVSWEGKALRLKTICSFRNASMPHQSLSQLLLIGKHSFSVFPAPQG